MSAKAPMSAVLGKLTVAKDWLEHKRASIIKIHREIDEIFFENTVLKKEKNLKFTFYIFQKLLQFFPLNFPFFGFLLSMI